MWLRPSFSRTRFVWEMLVPPSTSCGVDSTYWWQKIFPLINGGFHQTQRRIKSARGMPKLWQDFTTPKFVIQAHLQSTEDTGADRSKMRPEAQTTAAEGHEPIAATRCIGNAWCRRVCARSHNGATYIDGACNGGYMEYKWIQDWIQPCCAPSALEAMI